jgi:type VI protein secretion system component VasF
MLNIYPGYDWNGRRARHRKRIRTVAVVISWLIALLFVMALLMVFLSTISQ